MSISEQSYTSSPLESAEENFEIEEQVSRKVLPRVDASNSFFARWFAMIPADAPIREEEYYWPSGQALDADNFSDEGFERYLEKTKRKSLSPEDEVVLTLPEFLPQSSHSSAYSVSSSGETLSRQSTLESNWSEEDMQPPHLERQLSDWTKMPSLLPPLKEVGMARPTLERQFSNWDVMPALLPPLPREEGSPLSVPMFDKHTSDWSEMPQILPPLMDSKLSDTSDWVPMPVSIVPTTRAHASWETLPAPELENDLAHMQSIPNMAPLHYPQYSFYPSAGNVNNVGFVHNHAPNVPTTSTALVLYQQPIAEQIAQAIARSLAALYLQFSFYDIGEFYALAWHQPCAMFVTPSKTMTECYLNYMYPIVYIEKKSGLISTGFAHSQIQVDSTNFDNYNQELFKPRSNFTNYNNVDILRVD